MSDSYSLQQDIQQHYFIPPKPAVINQLQNMLQQEHPDISQVANLIAHDVGLAATVLCIINSPFFGMRRKISDIKQSVMLLGLDKIYSLVLSYYLKHSFTSQSCISLERFWDEAAEIADAMVFIGDNLHSLDENCQMLKETLPLESLYAVGLFHDCGIPALAQKHADYKELLAEVNNLNICAVASEENRYKTNHTVIGYYICKSWNLPDEICQLVLRHHEAGLIEHDTSKQLRALYCVLKLAENIIYELHRGKSAPCWQGIEAEVYDFLSIDRETYEDLRERLSALYEQ